jgi:hypothetical protein
MLNIKHFSTSKKLQACCMFVSPQDSSNPCYIWDIDNSTAAFSGHENVSRACTKWEFDTTEFGETITGKVNILICTRKEKGQVMIQPTASLKVLNGVRGLKFDLM